LRATRRRTLFDRIGRLIGGIHDASDRIGFARAPDRPHWDIDGLLGDAPLWGCFWQNPALTPPEAEVIKAARASARRWLQDRMHPAGDFGLIHADVLRENVLDGPGGLALIDFDDSGHGFRLYDLGTALVQSLEEPHLPALARALAHGYGAARGSAAPDLQSLTLFTLLRAMASCGWIVTRAGPNDPRQRFYAKRTLSLARHWLAGTSPLG
jgi:Ser/Thr protein kinase RdoA (MazF antagonist)